MWPPERVDGCLYGNEILNRKKKQNGKCNLDLISEVNKWI